MIHEILMSLSGHPSPLFDSEPEKVDSDLPLLSPSEKALLSSVGRLSHLHRDIRQNVEDIRANNKSSVCRAVACAIESQQLSKFQEKILEVETAILAKDAEFVGAYNIVPLASIVGEFAGWHRILEWLWDIVCSIKPQRKSELACSGPQLLNKIYKSTRTGYPDIEQVSTQLLVAAQQAWLRQLAEWILYGRLSAYAMVDLFIERTTSEHETLVSYEIHASRVPAFVTQDCSTSVLFLGNALHQLHSRTEKTEMKHIRSQLDLLPAHQRLLSSLKLPLVSSHLAEAVETIRTSLSRNVLQRLLPTEDVLKLLAIIRKFVLLEQGQFATSLIREADDRLQARSKQLRQHVSAKDSLRSMVLKEPEVNGVLLRAWAHLAALAADDDDELDDIELARELIHLRIGRNASNGNKSVSTGRGTNHGTSVFGQFLLPVPTKLELLIHSPYDLFISSSETQSYSSINAYLLAVRRGHTHLADLWKQSQLRREHPTPFGPPRSCTKSGRQLLAQRRIRSNQRHVDMRKVWATSSAVIFLLNEVGDYLEGQVIPSMWNHLVEWMKRGSTTHHQADAAHGATPRATTAASISQNLSRLTVQTDAVAGQQSHDPAALAKAHKAFLHALTDAILLNDTAHVAALAALLRAIDDLVAQVLRLQTIQHNLDLEQNDGVFDALGNCDLELKRCAVGLDRARKRADAGCRAVVARLREVSGGYGLGQAHELHDRGEGEYEPVCGVKLEWLLMKLDYSRQTADDGGEIISEQ